MLFRSNGIPVSVATGSCPLIGSLGPDGNSVGSANGLANSSTAQANAPNATGSPTVIAAGQLGIGYLTEPLAGAIATAIGAGNSPILELVSPSGQGVGSSVFVRADVIIVEALRGQTSLAISTNGQTLLAEYLRGKLATNHAKLNQLSIQGFALGQISNEVADRGKTSLQNSNGFSVSLSHAKQITVGLSSIKLAKSVAGVATVGGLSITDSARFAGAVSEGI